MRNMLAPGASSGLSTRLYSWLQARLRPRTSPDTPPDAATWNAQYEGGRWAYLAGLSELSRYSVLAGYVRQLRPCGALLDVGCGEGILCDRLRPDGFSTYVGVELSASGVEQARARGFERAEFIAMDAEQYVPTQAFDVIVFNEVLYFFRDPDAVVERYANALSDGGILLVSTCTAFRGGIDILRRLQQRFPTVDETTVTHTPNTWSWICTVLSRPQSS